MKPTRAQLRDLLRRDPALGAWSSRLRPFPGFPDVTHPRQSSHYAALASAIVYQQLSTAAATTIWNRVSALADGARFPEPAELLELDDARLRGAGLSAAKVAALRDLATRIEGGTLQLERLARFSDERIVEELVQVRGIGVWSAQMFLMFRLGRLDVFAPADLGLAEGVRLLDGLAERPGPRELEVRAERWRPLRSVASWMLWRLVEHERERARTVNAPRPQSSEARAPAKARANGAARATPSGPGRRIPRRDRAVRAPQRRGATPARGGASPAEAPAPNAARAPRRRAP